MDADVLAWKAHAEKVTAAWTRFFAAYRCPNGPIVERMGEQVDVVGRALESWSDLACGHVDKTGSGLYAIMLAILSRVTGGDGEQTREFLGEAQRYIGEDPRLAPVLGEEMAMQRGGYA